MCISETLKIKLHLTVMTVSIHLEIQKSKRKKGKTCILTFQHYLILRISKIFLGVAASKCLRIKLNYLYSDKTCVFVYVQITDIYSG